ncbi:CusA/CzcA family heavy metal efflux RND transporter [Nibricoccus aquaticus]|uniref:CusA/CzcA family heavy metal efflux RND transporter n=1 Tax=Nibricoccus aquaticus TaxID=2576891 RepID=A0A290QCC8_9BACT|nr:efflux RND transporter permease subunit [Nibricoccus aquaticus]ATC64860.1 CusA/CzcA family heavy metal efflux RND transporter [Nibricoccus aquaticus]
MLNKLIQWSLANRAIVLGLSLIILVLGLRTGTQLPVEVLPDLTKPTVIILTEAPGLAPEEVETRVTQPLESALMGVAGLTRLRSNSDVALSLVYAEFGWETDIYQARVLVQERLQSAREQLPDKVQPFMTPVASLMGEILLVGVRSTTKEGEPGYIAPSDVRTLADWTIKRRLQSIPGIAEILNMGGGVKQIEVQPDPYRMQAHDVSFAELEEAVAETASTTTGGFLSTGPTEIMVRNLAMTTDLGDIARTVIKKTGDRAVTIGDVAAVEWGIEPMRGDATVSVAPEKAPTYGVIMSITKAPGFDTRALTEQIQAALEELKTSFPPGVETTLLFQQKDFIDHAIGNLKEAIRDGAIMVTVVLFLFLLNFRTTFITLMAMPMSFAITLLVFHQFGISVNSMTLGGLAVAIGMVVDDAIVDVENVFRRLRENAALPHPRPKLQVIGRASGEVRNSILYATVLIILVFLPLLGLSGVEGKLFAPIAIATIISMVASFIVSLTLIPVLCSLLLSPKAGREHKDGRFVGFLKNLLRATLLRAGLNFPIPVLGVVMIGMIGAFLLYPKMSKDFLPSFREETALIAVTSAPGTSLEEMNKISDVIEAQILAVPEVRKVGRRLGRAERGDHVVPVSTAEFDVDFRELVGHEGKAGRSRKEILADLNRRLKTVPGVFAVVGGPLADRIGHMLSGVSAPVAIKVFGPDLDTLRRIGTEVQAVAKTIPGFEDAKLDQQSSIPQLRIEANRDRSAAYGVTPGAINDQLSALLGGKEIAELRDGQRAVNLVIRLPLAWRDSAEKIAQIPIEIESGQRVPLSLVADVREAKGPNVIFRENSQRRFTIAIKPTVRDVGALVAKLQEDVKAKVKLPEGYFITYEGEFQAQKDATQRIVLFSAVVFVIIVFLLYGYFQSMALALQVMLSIPLSLVGGLVYTWLKVDNISIATLVGFIAVGGVAARNGIMMLSHYLHLMKHEGEGFTRAMVERGTLERMVPVLMTALAAGIALIPLVLAGDQPGKEILHPVAVVIVGGLISSTLLEFLVRPLIFFHLGRKAAAQAIERDAAAAQ